MKISLGEWIAIFGLVAGLISALWAAIASFHTSKRDLAHAKRNAAQAQDEFLELGKKLDALELDLREVRTIIGMLLAERGETNSGFLGGKLKGRR
jgi:hypothetical protein